MILPSAQQLIQAGRTPGSILLDAYSRSSTRELGLAWLNLGYWSRGLSYPMACQNMATVVAKLANLENCTKVIDAGSGLGAPAIYWAQHYPHLKIHSLNIFADQIELAQREIIRLSLTKRITQHLNCATQMPFGDASFDAVIALESAFHFNTRADFFREAYRVLRPGGILALADMLPYLPVSVDEMGFSNLRKYRIAKDNLIPHFSYINQLGIAGFEITHSESIRSSVYPYFFNFICHLAEGGKVDKKIRVKNLDDELAYALWRQIYCLDDFILVSAIRREKII